jgi:hypothetical protein
MRQICPNCQQSVTVADSDAGKTVPCPACQQPFAIPALFAAQVFEPPPAPPAPTSPPAAPPKSSEAAPPTSTEPPVNSEAAAVPPIVALPVTPEGYRKLCSIALSRVVCHWLAPICLTFCFFLTFFNWVGSYPAGYAAYTQNGWQALIADLSVDPVSEKEMKMGGPLNQWLRSSWWLLPYMILLIVGVVLAWSEPLMKRTKLKFPPVVEGMLRLRPALVAACAGITLFFILVQCAAGFGVDRALNQMVQDKFKDVRTDAKTPEEIQRVEMQMAEVTGSFHMRTTIWLKLLIALHILALLAVAGETLLIHRGDKPPPRIGIMY